MMIPPPPPPPITRANPSTRIWSAIFSSFWVGLFLFLPSVIISSCCLRSVSCIIVISMIWWYIIEGPFYCSKDVWESLGLHVLGLIINLLKLNCIKKKIKLLEFNSITKIHLKLVAWMDNQNHNTNSIFKLCFQIQSTLAKAEDPNTK